MRKRRLVTGYLFGLTLALAGLTSAATAQTVAPRGNGKITYSVFKHDGIYSHSGIAVMNHDGSGRTQLTTTQIICPRPNRPTPDCGPDHLDFSPSWSPDGRQIAFMREVTAPDLRLDHNVYVMNADGSELRRLTRLGNVHFPDRPAWSPDGMKIAFTGPPVTGHSAWIYVINADGTGQTPLGQGACPAWAPNGSKLAICGGGGLQLMNPDGSGRTQITVPKNPFPNLVDYDWAPVWSPDGSRILFSRSVGCDWDDACQSITIWTVNADGSNPSKLADIEAYGRLAWSPDGTKIVFSANGDLFTMEANGSNVTNITNTPNEAEWLPSWQAVALAPLPAPNPTDDPEFFVRQHYRDFLGREPDDAGLDFWTNEITFCGADAQCVEAKRVNVSAAFFLSIEFQNTGYLVERVYKAAFGDSIDAPTGLAVPVVRRTELAADSALIDQGLVVNSPGWEQQLEANKRDYALAFVQRQRFTDVYSALTPAQFVDRLNQNAGGVLTEAEKSALVVELTSNNTAAGRASVLRKVAENAELDRREKNRAFVLMQYFGYLRRNPSDAPEANLNYAGWDFWLTKLNEFGGDFVRAEMVKAFLDSSEYRQRFGQ